MPAARATASDYVVERLRPPISDDLLAELCAVTEAINDAPMGTLDFEDEHFDLERMRAAVVTALARGKASPASIPLWDGHAGERIVDLLAEGSPRVEWIPPITVHHASDAYRASFC